MQLTAWFRSPRGSKLTASGLLAGPIALLLLLGLGEMASGEMSGVQHLVEAVPLLLVVVACWRWPRTAGIVLLFGGTLVFLLWLAFILTATERASPTSLAFVGIALVGPPLLAGALLLRAS